MKALLFDTETTGFNAETGNICQLSYIIIDIEDGEFREVLKAKNYYFSVPVMSPQAEMVHGLSIGKLFSLSEGIRFRDVAEEIRRDFDVDIVIGHNIKFDVRFIDAEFRKNGQNIINAKTFCTMSYYKPIMKLQTVNGRLKQPKLEESVNFLDIDVRTMSEKTNELFGGFSGFHDSRWDVSGTLLLITEGIEQGYLDEDFLEKI